MLRGAAALGDDGDLHILRQARDLLNEVTAEERPASRFGPQQKDLGYLLPAREVHQGLGQVLALQDPSLDLQVAREVQVFLQGLALSSGQVLQARFGKDAHGEASRVQEIGHALAAPNQGGGGGIGRDVNEDALG